MQKSTSEIMQTDVSIRDTQQNLIYTTGQGTTQESTEMCPCECYPKVLCENGCIAQKEHKEEKEDKWK